MLPLKPFNLLQLNLDGRLDRFKTRGVNCGLNCNFGYTKPPSSSGLGRRIFRSGNRGSTPLGGTLAFLFPLPIDAR